MIEIDVGYSLDRRGKVEWSEVVRSLEWNEKQENYVAPVPAAPEKQKTLI